jgi:CheY-like chemotaxis protein
MRTPRILVVDDDKRNISLIKGMLAQEMYEIDACLSGEEALTLLNDHKPDLILLDILMPGIDGFELCRMVKKNVCTRIIPIIMITALNERKDRQKALEAGAEDFLNKPLDKFELVARVKSLLRLKSYHDELVKSKEQLHKAQKMEAIGTLAGGVAHDLNNILSGILSYPELLLMDMAQEDPLRKSIETIQESGKKAAAIVDDLLTMARRGVNVSEVVNLNDIISEYFISPEFEKLKTFHPLVDFEQDFDSELMNIAGSSVHLSKTIMNLVSNAAEAMPDGGRLTISTQNQYIDQPVRGYDDVQKGDYVLLQVADTGIGISAEDLGRLFEPFFTKKTMGRSGTGLGMAVVWGTVQDHKGYIDVESCEEQGTTINVYFPITSKKISEEKKKDCPVESYMGNGESILVVDDVEKQREIASTILSQLNYSVDTVACGEAAVEYIKQNEADLLVLDMIMDPGIDGLETYKEILKLNAKQKAVITSGFSETDKVKEAQRLGAVQYVKKPYTIKNIGMAIKSAFEDLAAV